MLYRVITRCFWNKRLWEPDSEVELDPALSPPKHFIPAKDYKEPVVDKDVNDPMAPKPITYGQPIKSTTGFAAKLETPNPQPVEIKRHVGRPRKK